MTMPTFPTRHTHLSLAIAAIVFVFSFPFLSVAAEISAPVIEIEKNVLYMVPLGEKDGVRSGGIVEVMRDQSKIARLQFTSVLVDSAMAEVVELFDAAGIQDTDVAVFGGAKAGASASKPKPQAQPEPAQSIAAKVKKEPVPIEVIEDISVEVVEEKTAPRPPPEKSLEEESLRESSRQRDLQRKNTELQAEVKRLTELKNSESSGLRAELQQKAIDIDSRGREKTRMEFDLNQSKQETEELKQEIASLKQEMIPLKAMSSRTSKDGKDPFEKKIEDMNKTLVTLQRQCQEDVSVAREESRQELYNEYGRWEEKLNETKQLYEDQIEKYKTALREKDSSSEEVKNEKFGLAAKLGSTEQEANELRDKLKIVEEELEIIKSARSEKLNLTEDALKNKIDELSDLKGEYNEKTAALKKEHETTFGALKVKSEEETKQLRESSQKEIATLKAQQSEKIQQAKDSAHKGFLQEKGQLLSKMSQMEADYNSRLSAAEKSVDEKTAALGEREALVTFLKGEKDKLAEGLKQSEDTVKELQSQNARVQEELRSARATTAEQIKSATDVLSQEVANLKSREEALKKELDGKLSMAQESALRETESLKSLYEKRLEDARLEYEKKFKTQDDRMLEKDNVIASLRDQNALVASEIEKKNVQISNLKEENADLNGQVRSVKIPLQEKIEGLNRVIFSLESAYEEKLKTVKEKAEGDLKKSQEELGAKLAQAEGRGAQMETKVKEQEAAIVAFKNENSNLKEDVNRGNGAISGLESELANLKQEFKNEKSLTAERMLSAKAPLESMIEKLTQETDSLKIKYEQKLREERDLSKAALDQQTRNSQDEIAKIQAQSQEKIAALNNDLSNLAKGKDVYINTMLSELKDKQSIITLLTAKKDELENHFNNSKKEIAALTQESSLAKADLAAAGQAYEAQIASTTVSLEKTIEELNSKLALAEKEYEQGLAARQRDSQKQISLEQTQWETAFQTMKNEYEAKIVNQKKEMEEILIDRETKLTEEISKGNEQANEFKNQTEKKMHAFAAELEEKRTLIESLNKEKQNMALKLEEKNQQIASFSHDAGRLTEELKSAKNIGAEKIRMIQNPLEAKIKELERKLASEQQGRGMEMANKEKEFVRVRDTLERDLAAFRKMHEEKIVALKTDSKRELEDNEKKWQARLDSTVKEYERLLNIKTKGLEDQLDARQTDLKTTIAKTMEDSQRALRLNNEQWQKRVSDVEEERGVREQELRAKHAEEVSGLRKQITALENQVKTGDVQVSDVLKGRDQRIEALTKEKDAMMFELEENRRQLLSAKEGLVNLKASQSEMIRSATVPLESKIQSLSYELAALKKESENKVESSLGDAQMKIQERERLWAAKFEDLKRRYEDELKAERRSLEEKLGKNKETLQAELDHLRDEFIKLKDDKDSELFSLQVGYEDEIRAVKEESQQKINDLAQDLSETRVVYGDTEQLNNTDPVKTIKKVAGDISVAKAAVSVSRQPSPALEPDGYFNLVRKMILDSIRDVDIMSYKSDEEYVKIEFELYADGSLKTAPQFLGTNNEDLKENLYQYFLKALPFPPFPETMKKRSQRFAIMISFKADAT
jgi:chromosome segregation ATPase